MNVFLKVRTTIVPILLALAFCTVSAMAMDGSDDRKEEKKETSMSSSSPSSSSMPSSRRMVLDNGDHKVSQQVILRPAGSNAGGGAYKNARELFDLLYQVLKTLPPELIGIIKEYALADVPLCIVGAYVVEDEKEVEAILYDVIYVLPHEITCLIEEYTREATPEELCTLVGHRSAINQIIGLDSKKGIIASTASGWGEHSIKIWDLGTGQCLRTIEDQDSNISMLTQLPDSSIAAITRGVLKIYDIGTGECTGSLSMCSAFTPIPMQGAQWALAVGRGGGEVVLFNPTENKYTRLAGGDGNTWSGISHICRLEDGRLVLGNGIGRIFFLDLNNGSITPFNRGYCCHYPRKDEGVSLVNGLLECKDGRIVSTSDSDNKINVYGAEAGDVKCAISANDTLSDLTQLSNGLCAAICNGKICVIDPSKGTCYEISETSGGGCISCFQELPNGRLALGTSGGFIEIRDLETGKLVRKFKAHNSCISTLILYLGRHNKGVLISGDCNGVIKAWQ